MKDFILLIVVLVAFIYGYFLMEKLDKFLKENQSQKLISDSKLRIGFETPAIIDSIADLLEQFSSEYPNYELDLFYGSVSEIINGLGNNKLDFGFIIENSNDILKDEYCSLSLQIKQSVITPGSIDIAVHPINTIEKPARVIWQNDINCMKGLFVEKLRDFSERFLLSATRPNGKKEENKVHRGVAADHGGPAGRRSRPAAGRSDALCDWRSGIAYRADPGAAPNAHLPAGAHHRCGRRARHCLRWSRPCHRRKSGAHPHGTQELPWHGGYFRRGAGRAAAAGQCAARRRTGCRRVCSRLPESHP